VTQLLRLDAVNVSLISIRVRLIMARYQSDQAVLVSLISSLISLILGKICYANYWQKPKSEIILLSATDSYS